MILKRIRPSNLVLLAAAPFLVVLFASSSKYLRSLKAIIGIEPGAPALLVGFLLLLALLASGFLAARRWAMDAAAPRWLAAVARLALPIHALVIVLILAVPPLTDPFVQSVLFRSLDPAASELVDRAARPWTLKAEVLPLVSQRFRIGLAVYGLLFLAFTLAVAWAAGALRQGCIRGFEAVSGIALFYLVFISHWGFATGIAVTFRAAVFAYLLAAVLGLTWTGLQSLRSSRATIPIFGAISLLLLAAAALFWAQPRVEYVMVGSTEARIAIVKGTPQAVADVIRFGEYEGGDGASVRIRSAPDVATALQQIAAVDSVSGAFRAGLRTRRPLSGNLGNPVPARARAHRRAGVLGHRAPAAHPDLRRRPARAASTGGGFGVLRGHDSRHSDAGDHPVHRSAAVRCGQGRHRRRHRSAQLHARGDRDRHRLFRLHGRDLPLRNRSRPQGTGGSGPEPGAVAMAVGAADHPSPGAAHRPFRRSATSSSP